MQGSVRWFRDDLGYGFLEPDDSDGDVFVHHRAIQMHGHRTLYPEQRVEFEVKQGPKGPEATDVRVVG